MKEGIWDIHSHILPGIDDGSRNWDMTMQMIMQSWEAGVRNMIATPHYLPWHHRLKAESVLMLVQETQEKAQAELGIDMRIYPGEELYYHNDLLNELEQGKALTLAESRYVLVEFGEDAPYSEIRIAAEKFRRSPWKLIIAHVERYEALRKKDNYVEILNMGVELQSNAEEMQRRMFDKTKRWLKRCYDKQEITYVGSDAHDPIKRPPLSDKSLKWFQDHLDAEYREKLFGGGHFVNC